MSNKLDVFLEGAAGLKNNQFAYRTTGEHGLLLAQKIEDALTAGHEINAVFLDCTKAFDKVNHRSLLGHLEKLNLPSDFVGLMGSYLRNRTQCVTVNGKLSTTLPLSSGVPQGSILGPRMFYCQVDDAPQALLEGSELIVR